MLLIVVGIQLLTLGLLGEMLTSQHAEKSAGAEDTARAYVRDVLR